MVVGSCLVAEDHLSGSLWIDAASVFVDPLCPNVIGGINELLTFFSCCDNKCLLLRSITLGKQVQSCLWQEKEV